MDQLKDILDSDENILWEDKPTFIPFIATGLPFLAFGIIWGLIDYGFIKNSLSTPNFINTMIPFFLLHLMPLWLSILNVVRLLLSFNNTRYAITNKRVILRTGFWGIDFKSIDYDKIIDIRVDVNPIEKIFSVGSIRINTNQIDTRHAQVHDSITAITNPYEVFKKIKTVSVNIKTDWNYPNKLRPEKNSGYETKYTPESD